MPEVKRIQRKRQNPVQRPLWAFYRLHVFPRNDPRFRQRLRGYIWALPKAE